MKHFCRKVLAVFLSMAVLVSFAALTASAASYTDVPTVYLYGYGSILNADKTDTSSKQIYPVTIPGSFASDVLDQVKGPLSKGIFLHNWDDFHRVVIDTVCGLYEDAALDQNGELNNNSGNRYANYTYPLNQRRTENGYELNTYNYSFDWRLDPFKVADGLAEFIEEVCKATDSQKVNLMGRCLGCNIILAYVQAYGFDRVDQICFYVPGFQGFECIGALFSGEINLDPDAIPDFLDHSARAQYGGEDNPTYDLLVTALEFLNAAKTLNVAKPIFDNYLIPEFRKYILPEILRRTFGTFPSFWSFVGDEYYAKAKQTVFGGYEDTYAGIIEKADHYHNDVMANADKLVMAGVEQGVETYIVCKYGSRMGPVLKNADVQGDSTVTTANSSFGATTASLYGTLSNDYIQRAQAENGGKYLSADHQIDASTCLLPNHTWFIKNLYHHELPESVHQMIAEIFDFDGYTTVFDLEQYPQYQIYDRTQKTISPLTGDAPAIAAPKYSFFKKLVELFKLIISLLKK